METSSPLAAMRPAPPSFGRRDLFGSHNAHFTPSSLGGGGLTLREQFNFHQTTGYFNVKTVRGSSPTASLAADLSQNFKLNDSSSPMFPTPRRALFTTAAMMDAIEGRGKRGPTRWVGYGARGFAEDSEYVTTPPMPLSSSPGHVDMMEMSPLPHKAPYVVQVEVPSPTPTQSPADEIMLDSPLPRQTSLEPPKPVVADRRKLGLRRPSLNRVKGYSTGAIPARAHAPENQLPPFRFGGDSQITSCSPSMSLSECFQDSPPQERRPQSANSPCPPMASLRVKPQFASLSGMGNSRNGSPITSHARRTSNPFMRPRKQFRRSLSMFENPGEIMKPQKEEPTPPKALQAVMDIDESAEPVLPHFFPEGSDDNIPRISQSTMLGVLDGKYTEHFSQKMIVDCRFEYEYDGGHIDGAINYNDKELLASHLFNTPMEGRTLLIFHCEYSAHRAPIMARHIRAQDRNANIECYPKLTYPEVYILDGGYSGFFSAHRNRCHPQAYVEMNAAEHVNTCERKMGRLRQGRRGLGRAQTFAFGSGRTVQDSPTAPGRAGSRDCDFVDMIGASPILGNDRPARRMVSF
ncbi:hypothetical protein B0T26DRAFT_73461 [Lasiosphaeria miniovina]|uniref:M-phase inducer phosphatase n=1 Tax=Lasiosphaeria miniovina TaxID=1954250 RepID=A0AA40EAJ8_9PEZI|nr:uncharacterized protein B0T26DRAFT_73461 [Lasiosphaeria miniovina]KAK0734479.1 hypothetical protein B0T26DRAFT_73461 [Lasiosphaeria miniovina]